MVKPLEDASARPRTSAALVEMGQEDEGMAAEVPGELERMEKMLDELEIKSLLSGPLDGNSALLTINARDGGTDARDWAEMLLRMYLDWAKDHEYDTELLDRQDNEEAGIDSATIAVRGPMAYGYLKGEAGIHRLVRISPFNAEGKRQTSFAAVDVSPEVSDDVEIEIRDVDLEEQAIRSSGPAGSTSTRPPAPSACGTSPPAFGLLPGRAEPAQESVDGVEDAARPAGADRGRKTRGRAGRQVHLDAQGRLRLADPQLLPASRSAGEGLADRLLHGQLPRRAGRQYPRFSRRLLALSRQGRVASRPEGE